MTAFYMILALAVVGGAVYWTMQRQEPAGSSSAPEPEPAKPQTKEEVEQVKHEDTVQKLLNINLHARLQGIDAEIATSLESAIDSIRHISQDMAKMENFSELSVLFGRITDRYVPELVNGYLKLSEGQRAERKEETLKSIQMIEAKTREIEDSLSDESIRDFDKTAVLINTMLKQLGGE